MCLVLSIMDKIREVFVWANPDKTISVSFGSTETEVKMTLEVAKEKFLGAIRAAEDMAPPGR